LFINIARRKKTMIEENGSGSIGIIGLRMPTWLDGPVLAKWIADNIMIGYDPCSRAYLIKLQSRCINNNYYHFVNGEATSQY